MAVLLRRSAKTRGEVKRMQILGPLRCFMR